MRIKLYELGVHTLLSMRGSVAPCSSHQYQSQACARKPLWIQRGEGWRWADPNGVVSGMAVNILPTQETIMISRILTCTQIKST